jgi:hypothetical protein
MFHTALVGANVKYPSHVDMGGIRVIVDWVKRQSGHYLSPELSLWQHSDIINLHEGRDFLRETHRYEIVILFSIHHPTKDPVEDFVNDGTELCLSPQHSLEAWRQRLIQTDAHVIYVTRMKTHTISGRNLGELAGYTRLSVSRELTVYQRKITVGETLGLGDE